MTFDWTVRLTDIVMILAVIAGPILAVLATEVYRRRKEASDRREAVFRVLMATRNATLVPHHIENLNLVDTVFHGSDSRSRAVVDQWKVYLQHLGDRNYPQQTWSARKVDLFHDLLQKMSLVVGYSFDLSHIKGGTYYPEGYEAAELEQASLRKLLLKIIAGEESLKVSILPPNNEAAFAAHKEMQDAIKGFLGGKTQFPIVVTESKTQANKTDADNRLELPCRIAESSAAGV